MDESGIKWRTREKDKGAWQVFFGQYRHSIDDKGRLIMPAKYREPLADGLIMTRALDDPCIYVYTRTEWPVLEGKLRELPISSDLARRAQRLFFSNASDEEISKQGRISIPAHLREFAKIDRDVVVAGVGSRLEIWSAENWDSHTQENEGELTGESLAQFGI